MKMCDCNQGRLPCTCKPKPAEQHQGEPVELPERKRVPSARATTWNAGIEGFNECLDKIEKLGPLYTHHDSGELERLRVELREQREIFGMQEDKIDTLRAQIEVLREGGCERAELIAQRNDTIEECNSLHGQIAGLRAQLAERDALLREGVASCYEAAQMAEQIERAEPIRVSTTLMAPARPFKLADAKGKAGVLKARLIEMAEALSASAEPSALNRRDDFLDGLCPFCIGYGSIASGITESPSAICEECGGTGKPRAALGRKS